MIYISYLINLLGLSKWLPWVSNIIVQDVMHLWRWTLQYIAFYLTYQQLVYVINVLYNTVNKI